MPDARLGRSTTFDPRHIFAPVAIPQSAPIVRPQPRGRACTAPAAVNIAAANSSAQPVIVGNRVELQLLTTLQCNLACSYCSLGVGDVLGSQKRAWFARAAQPVRNRLLNAEVYELCEVMP